MLFINIFLNSKKYLNNIELILLIYIKSFREINHLKKLINMKMFIIY